jgi:hypothetical protein
MLVDTFMVYQFIKKLITPFNKMPAYERGLIDDKGNFLRDRKYYSPEDKKALGLFDTMIINLKKLIAKLPAGNTRIATMAAALMLLRTSPVKKMNEEAFINGMFGLEDQLKTTMEELRLAGLAEDHAPVNAVAGIAGLTPDTLGVPVKAATKYKRKNISQAPKLIGLLRR